MKKFFALFISAILCIFCGYRTWLFPQFIWTGTLYILAISLYYIYSVFKGKIRDFCVYIGWTWCIIPICFTMFMLFDRQTTWNRVWIFIGGACIGLVYVTICEKYKVQNDEMNIYLRTITCLLIAGTLSFCVMGINESAIRYTEYDVMELLEKDTYSSTQSFLNRDSYYLYFSYYNGDVSIEELQVSEYYYSSLKEGDMIPICVCTGLFGKKFYTLYEDPDKEFDFYGLNEWVREQAILQNQL